MSVEYEYDAYDAEEMIGGNLMAQIEGIAQEQLDAEELVESLGAQLSEAKAQLRNINEKRLPDLLDEAELGDSTITTPRGLVVKVGEIIRGSIPKGKEAPAFEWLEETKNGKLIKRTFQIEFGKGDDKWADKFERDCRQRKKPLNIKRAKGVNTTTLRAFVRQQLKDGVDFPMDLFGVYCQRIAKVKVKS